MITGEMPMEKAMLDHNGLLPLLPRFGIRLGGFGDSSVEEVCAKYHINTGFFLQIANAYLDESYIPNPEFSNFSLGTMISYLKKTHEYYLQTAIPQIEKHILHLLEHSGLAAKEKDLVTGFFNDYKKEVLEHIAVEEEKVMPYILELEQQSARSRPGADFVRRLREYSIKEFAMEHDRLEYSLENLSKLIIKYLPPFDDQELCIELLRETDCLVRDLVDHADMEDKVLVPRVSDLEKLVLQRAGTA